MMYKVIEDFSTENVNLVIEQWGNQTMVAYTYDSSSESTAIQLFKALQKYKKLYFDCEIDDRHEIRRIHQSMREHMKRLYGERIETETKRDNVTLFKLANNNEKV